jgi:hypothetical protein
MKKVIIFLFCWFIFSDIKGQKIDLGREIVEMFLYIPGGMCDGWNQQINYHYQDFKKVFPRADDQYWDPDISWENKYEWKDGVIVGKIRPGSTTWGVWRTDGNHLTRTGNRWLSFLGVVVNIGGEKLSLKNVGKNMVKYSIGKSIGFHISYTVLPKLN